jgi:multidrug efflux pump
MRYTGQQQEQDEASRFLFGAFLIALMLIAFVLVSQFNSVVKPLIILSAVLMSTVGVLPGAGRVPDAVRDHHDGRGHHLAGRDRGEQRDRADRLHRPAARARRARRREALVQAGITRFRPVVLTAVTTVLGLVPLAIGLNFDFVGLFTALSPNLYWGGEQAAWWGRWRSR